MTHTRDQDPYGVHACIQQFVPLCPRFVDIEEKKIESFKRDLSTKLMKTMANSRCTTYHEFINDALT